MSNLLNSLSKTDFIKQFQSLAPKNILNAIDKASDKTGVNFAYLVKQAQMESNFNPSAEAKTSSATGLYQFIDQTWLSMMKRHGGKHGLSQFADMIEMKNGKARVASPQDERAILNLRNNPDIASKMAAELAKSNERYLKHHVKGFEAKPTDLYLAHFMGANGAARFLNAMNQNPDQNAAALFSKEARANKNVFFDKDSGKARSLNDVYAFFDKKMNNLPGNNNKAPIAIAETDQTKATDTPPKPAADHVNDIEALQYKMANMMLGGATAPQKAFSGLNQTMHLNSETLYFIQNLIAEMDNKTAFLSS